MAPLAPALRRGRQLPVFSVGSGLAGAATDGAQSGEALASKALGRQVTIGRVQFLPWSLELSLHDVSIADARGQGFLLQVQRIYIDMELQSLWRLAPIADAVEVYAPMVHVAQLAPGHTDLDDVIAAVPIRRYKSNANRLCALQHRCAWGALDFVDHSVNRTHEVRDLEFSLPFISNLKAQRQVKVVPRLAFRLNGSAFDSLAEAAPFADSLRTDASIHLVDFDLALIGATFRLRCRCSWILRWWMRICVCRSSKPLSRWCSSVVWYVHGMSRCWTRIAGSSWL